MNGRDRTIRDFGEQWVHYQDNEGYYGSVELFADIAGPLLSPSEIAGLKIIEIGSGTGRIVNMLLACGASHVTAVEPSEAFHVLKRNISDPARTTCLNISGQEFPDRECADLIVSIGVLHHIPDPGPVVQAAYRALRPGGRVLVWLYGREGNRLYLTIAKPLRAVTMRLPHALLSALVRILDIPVTAYVWASRHARLPMRGYVNSHFSLLSRDKRRLTIYDQLNPAYAKYYSQEEARQLLADAGFSDIQAHHRHQYSWTLVGRKPL